MSVMTFTSDDPALSVAIARTIERFYAPATAAKPPSEAPAEPSGGFFLAECKAARGGKKRVVTIPVGTVLRHTYKGQTLTAKVTSRTTVEFAGVEYSNLTRAAFEAAKTINPDATRPNGCYWWARETAPGVWTTLYRT